MNYIIHNPTDLQLIRPQIDTCRDHALAQPGCSPDCEVCAERLAPLWEAAHPDIIPDYFEIEEQLERFSAAQEEVADILRGEREARYRAEYERLSAQLGQPLPLWVDADYEPEQCGPDCPWHGIPQPGPCLDPAVGESEAVLSEVDLAQFASSDFKTDTLPKAELDLAYEKMLRINAETKLEELETLCHKLTADWDRFEPVASPLIEAAIALEKEADYLHPYSGEVADVVARFRAAVLNYKKADEKA